MASKTGTGVAVQVAVATPSRRRALRTRLLCFYAQHEPDKSIKDVNDLCEWAIANGVDAFNAKLKVKYGEDLSTIKATSVAELNLVTQLRLFYGEFDPERPMSEVKKVEQWVDIHGIVALNERMLERYSENLNSLCFGGREHLLELLTAFYTKHDPSKSTPEHLQTIRDWTLFYGPLRLNEKLLEKYGDILHLSIEDIEKSVPAPITQTRERAQSELPTPQVWAEAISNRPKAPHTRLSLQSATSGMTTYVGTSTVTGAVDPMIDSIHLQRLVELFYARHAPQKLVEDNIVDKVVEWTKRRGIQELNKKLRATYNTDLEDLETEYFALYDELELFYAKHEPKKLDVGGGLDDVVAWGLVHGTQPLSDRLKSKYGEGLGKKSVDIAKLKSELRMFYAKFEPDKSSEDIDTIVSWTLANSREALCVKIKAKFGVDLDDYKTKPAIVVKQVSSTTTPPLPAAATRTGSTGSEDGTLNQSVIVTNELPAALGGTSNRLSNLGRPRDESSANRRASVGVKEAPTPSPQPLGMTAPPTRTTRGSVVTRPAGAPIVEAAKPPVAPAAVPPPPPPPAALVQKVAAAAASAPAATEPSPSLKNEESEETMEAEMGRMQQVVSGNFTHLGAKLQLFYQKHDPKKLNDKEGLDLIIKWTLKHGINALNDKLKEKWGENLNDIAVPEEPKKKVSDAPELPVF